MKLILNLDPLQLPDAIRAKKEIENNLSRAPGGDGWHGDLLGYIELEEPCILTLGFNKIIYDGPRDIEPAVRVVIRNIVGPDLCDAKVLSMLDDEYSGFLNGTPWYVPADVAMGNKLGKKEDHFPSVRRMVHEIVRIKKPIKYEVYTNIKHFSDHLPSSPKVGTPAYRRATADGTIQLLERYGDLKQLVDLLGRQVVHR